MLDIINLLVRTLGRLWETRGLRIGVHVTENRSVGGSIPPLGTIKLKWGRIQSTFQVKARRGVARRAEPDGSIPPLGHHQTQLRRIAKLAHSIHVKRVGEENAYAEENARRCDDLGHSFPPCLAMPERATRRNWW